MACKVKNVRQAAIYDVIRVLKTSDPSIDNLAKVEEWFKTNYPGVSRAEIIDALVLPSKQNIDDSKKVLRDGMNSLRSQAKTVNKIDMLLSGMFEKFSPVKTAPSPALQQVKDFFGKLQELAKKDAITQDDVDTAIAMAESLPLTEGVNEATLNSAIGMLKAEAKEQTAKRKEKHPPMTEAEKKAKAVERGENARVKRAAEKISGLLEGVVPAKKKRPIAPTPESVKQFNEVLGDLYALAGERGDLSNEQYGDIIMKLEDLQENFADFFNVDDTISRESVDKAIANIRDIRKAMKVDSLEKSLAKEKAKIESLSGDDIDLTSIVTEQVAWKPVDAEILKKQHQLHDLRQVATDKLERIRLKKRAQSGFNILNVKFTGKKAIRFKEWLLTAKDNFWELPRTLGFMMDDSALMVQAGPVVSMDLTSAPINAFRKYVLGDNEVEVTSNYKRVGQVINEGFLQVVGSDWAGLRKDLRTAGKSTAEALRHTSGTWVREKYQELVEHPLYDLMIQAGLKLSQAKSLTDSEEYFRTTLVNKVPVAGWMKDISEDAMVTTLNLYRSMMFEQFYKSNPRLSPQEYGKVAEMINNLTGTTKEFGQVLGPAAYVSSAPRLLYSRFKLYLKFLALPGIVMAKGDLKGTLQSFKENGFRGGLAKGIKFQSPADAYVVNQLAGLGASYAAWAGFWALAGTLAGLLFGGDDNEYPVQFEVRPLHKNFLRTSIGSTSYDFTGGIGAVARLVGQIVNLSVHVPGRDYTEEQRVRALLAQKEDALDAVLSFAKGRLHPTFSRTYSVWSGRDFFGDPYQYFGTEGVGPHLQAALAALTPIFLETTLEQYGSATPNSGFWEDSAISMAQFTGVNTFEYSDKTDDVRVQRYFNEIKYEPSIRYPEELSKKIDGRSKDYLKKEYKMLRGQRMADFILDYGADPQQLPGEAFQKAWDKKKKEVDAEFMAQYKEYLIRISDDPVKLQKEIDEKKKKGSKPHSRSRAHR